jgi:hypothetical protein
MGEIMVSLTKLTAVLMVLIFAGGVRANDAGHDEGTAGDGNIVPAAQPKNSAALEKSIEQEIAKQVHEDGNDLTRKIERLASVERELELAGSAHKSSLGYSIPVTVLATAAMAFFTKQARKPYYRGYGGAIKEMLKFGAGASAAATLISGTHVIYTEVQYQNLKKRLSEKKKELEKELAAKNTVGE